ncbi:hypothetical protein BENNIE_33 [Arthrobacter phage Bennie]|uniref:Uncharacterized protein n=3 Tax=Korravirus bennie TaxID=1982077 RepID=A0A386K900_9CAUD|nr:hypothetical protein FDH55_gp33 [Arthrobacter phage Bennie]ALY08570.1 hypothetical protein BENNIE_33 [Arthrobacter phage Bennie]AYD81729.1 hypothetical protein Moki_33 [Arthrobacter phage Moki]AZS12406.1 hypothetical protein SEA_HEADNERD_33 [Arthrobacter phage HeadNerd]
MYKVAYIGGGKWEVRNEAGELVGVLRQGITQAWTARTANGELRLIKTFREYGGTANPWEIANELVIW